jgi:hypothetical protein
MMQVGGFMKRKVTAAAKPSLISPCADSPWLPSHVRIGILADCVRAAPLQHTILQRTSFT